MEMLGQPVQFPPTRMTPMPRREPHTHQVARQPKFTPTYLVATTSDCNGNIKLEDADTQPAEVVVEEDEPVQDHVEANIPLYR